MDPFHHRKSAGERPLSITITPGTVLTAIVIGLLVWLVFYLKGLVLIVLTAVVIASAVEPGIAWFQRRGWRRIFSVLAVYLLVFGILFAVAYLFFPPLVNEARGFLSSLPQYLNSVDIGNVFSFDISSSASAASSSLSDSLLQFQTVFSAPGEGAFRTLAAFFGGIVSFFLIIVLSFYFAVEETGVDDFIRVVVPVEHQSYALNLWKRSHQKIGLWMQGQIVLSCIMGIFAFLWLTILGIKFSMVLAFVAALAELIPIFGPIIAGITAVAVAAASSSTSTLFLVAGGFLILHELEANLIYPLVVKKVVGVPPLLVILALFAGGELAGFLGILLSVPAAATLQEFVSDVRKSKERDLARLKEKE
jgi:predicted PurR-regulated permease PerM